MKVTDSQTSSSSLASSTVTVEDNCSFQTIGNSGLSQILSPQSVEDNTFSNTVYLQLDELPIKENSTSQYVSEAEPFNSELLDLLKSANAGRALLATYSQSGLLQWFSTFFVRRHLNLDP